MDDKSTRPSYMAPEWVCAMNRRARIAWHTARIRRELPAHELVESLKSDLEPEDIRFELQELKGEIQRVQAALQLRESPQFQKLREEQVRVIADLKVNLSMQARIQTSVFYKRATQSDMVRLAHLQQEAVHFKSVARSIEVQMAAACAVVGTDATEYLLLDAVVRPSRTQTKEESTTSVESGADRLRRLLKR